MNFKVEPEFQDLIPPLSDLEYETLEQSIIEEGCRDPLVIWAGENVLLDGHNRYKICLANNISYEVIKKQFDTEDAAKNWMLVNQLGRRNLSPESLSLLRGELYKLGKTTQGGDHKSKGKNYPLKNTAQELAKKMGVSEKTIRNDEKFVDAVNGLTAKLDKDFKKKVQDPEVDTPSKTDIIKASEIAETKPELAKKIMSGEATKEEKAKLGKALGVNEHELICAASLDAMIRLRQADKGSDYEKADEKDFKMMADALRKLSDLLESLNAKIGTVYHKKFKPEVKK